MRGSFIHLPIDTSQTPSCRLARQYFPPAVMLAVLKKFVSGSSEHQEFPEGSVW